MTSSPDRSIGIITRIEPQRRQMTRVNVHIDGAFAFAARADTLALLGLSEGDELTGQQRAAIVHADAVATAWDSAVGLLARRPRSEREIRDALRRKINDPAVIDEVIGRLVERRYLDDRDFARFWIENRSSFRPRGEIALRQELRAKGIDRDIVDQTLASAELDDVSLALDAARRKVRSMSGLDPATRRRRLIGFLQRRGFTYGVIRTTLERLDAPNTSADDGDQVPDFD